MSEKRFGFKLIRVRVEKNVDLQVPTRLRIGTGEEISDRRVHESFSAHKVDSTGKSRFNHI